MGETRDIVSAFACVQTGDVTNTIMTISKDLMSPLLLDELNIIDGI
jgi:hypothetical protein